MGGSGLFTASFCSPREPWIGLSFPPLDLPRVRALHVPDQRRGARAPDHHHDRSSWPPPGRGGRGREGVVVVVPALAERRAGRRPSCCGSRRACGSRLLAEHVADRVHAERRVLEGGRCGSARPRRAPRVPPADRAADRVAERERQPERERDPEQVEPVDRADQPVLVEVARRTPVRAPCPGCVKSQPMWACRAAARSAGSPRRGRRAASADRRAGRTAHGACGGRSPTASPAPASSCSRGSRAAPARRSRVSKLLWVK